MSKRIANIFTTFLLKILLRLIASSRIELTKLFRSNSQFVLLVYRENINETVICVCPLLRNASWRSSWIVCISCENVRDKYWVYHWRNNFAHKLNKKKNTIIKSNIKLRYINVKHKMSKRIEIIIHVSFKLQREW